MNNILDARVVERAMEFKENWLQPLVPQFLSADRPLSFGAIVNIAFASSDQQLITGMSLEEMVAISCDLSCLLHFQFDGEYRCE